MRRACFNAVRAALVGCFFAAAMPAAAENAPRGGHVQWARLNTGYEYWSRHTQTEPMLLNCVRENTSLGIDQRWAVADVHDMESLAAFPCAYAEGIQTVSGAVAQHNLREFLLRGGFLLIDACINPEVNPEPDVFLAGQARRFREILPSAKISRVPSGHAIYRSFFRLEKLPQSFMDDVFDPRWAKHPLYAVELEGPVVSIISLAGMKCGWSFSRDRPAHRIESMPMLVNIYAFALMH